MSKVCDICGRGTQTGNTVSHSQAKSPRKFKVNIQIKKMDGESKKVCAKCIKTLSKSK